MKTRVKAGRLRAGVVYEVDFACDTPGPEIEEGRVVAYWTGETDAWGKLTFRPTDGGPDYYLFAHEIVALEAVCAL